MWVLLLIIEKAVTMIVSNRMSAAAQITPVVASVDTAEPLIQKKLLRSYPEVVNYLQSSLQTTKR